MSEPCMRTTDALLLAADKIQAKNGNPLTPDEAQWILNTIRVGAEQLEKFQEEAFAARRALDPRAAELAAADKDGRLVVLPCKVGDTYYRIFHGTVIEDKVRTVFASENFKDVLIRGQRFDSEYPNFKKVAFTTRAEAEAALAAQKGGGDA